jgi:probable F420-dependent oxidoreductase
MEFGISLPTDPPVGAQVDKAKLAEACGFTNVWCWDTHILMQEYSPQMTLIAANTERVGIGACVTNPVTRHATVVASFFATLANLIGSERVMCGIGRGDSAVRIRGAKPARLAQVEEAIGIIRALSRGDETEVEGYPVKLEWATGGQVPVYLGAYGPRALRLAGRVADGVILQVADPFFVEWCLRHVEAGLEEEGRDPAAFKVQVAAPSYPSDDRDEARAQLRWFPALVGNHIADILRHHDPEEIPDYISHYVEARTHYDYRQHTRPEAEHYDYVPDEIIDRFTVLGTVAEVTEKLRNLESIGVTEFNMYTTFENPERVIETYGRDVIPSMATVTH